MSRNRSSGQRYFALTALALAGACGGSKATFNETKPAGSGAESGWTFLPTASDDPGSGGKSGGGSGGGGGKGGSASGGASGHGGVAGATAGAGGAVVLPPITFKCGGTRPDQPLITTFDGFAGDRWESPGNVNGGIYVYPDDSQAAAGEFLRFADQVKTWTGIGIWFSGCLDASQYRGVRFTISGDAGPAGTVQLLVITNRDKNVDTKNRIGSCLPLDPNEPWPSCHPPGVSLPVTSEPVLHSIPWSALLGGMPSDKTDGSDLLDLEWAFDWTNGGTPYPAQLTVDNVEFWVDAGSTGDGGAPATGNDGGAPTSPDNGQGGN